MSDVRGVVSVAVVNEEGEHFKETVVEHLPGIDSLPVGTELVDRAHVTRMQAEVERLSECLEQSQADLARMTEGRDGLRSTLDEANKVIAWQRGEKPDLVEIEKLRRDARNDAIAYKAVIEKQEEIRAERDQLKAEIDRLRTAEGDAMTYKAGMENVAQQRDQLKAEYSELNADYLKACADFDAMTSQRDRLKAENEALRQFILGFAEYDAEIAHAFAAMSKEGKL